MTPTSLYHQILSQLRADNYAPRFFEHGGLPQDCYPDLHERQIERYAPPDGPTRLAARENNRTWAEDRRNRIDEHARRVGRHLRQHSRRKPPGEARNGRRQQVWCVELRQVFTSLSAAGRFVNRAPSNVLQAIRHGVRCGAFHWERYEEARHGTAIPQAAPCDHGRALIVTGAAGALPPEQHDGRVGGQRSQEHEHRPVPIALHQPAD